MAAWMTDCKDTNRLQHGDEIFIATQNGKWRAARVLINKPHVGKFVIRFKNGKTLNYFLKGKVRVPCQEHSGVLVLNQEMIREFGKFPEEGQGNSRTGGEK